MSSQEATAKATGRNPTDPAPAQVTVEITAGTTPKVSPDLARISIRRDEEVVWACKDAQGQPHDFKVIFKGESPFHERVYHNGNPHSNRPRPDVTPDPTRSYEYLVIAGGTLDPSVIVEQ